MGGDMGGQGGVETEEESRERMRMSRDLEARLWLCELLLKALALTLGVVWMAEGAGMVEPPGWVFALPMLPVVAGLVMMLASPLPKDLVFARGEWYRGWSSGFHLVGGLFVLGPKRILLLNMGLLLLGHALGSF